MAIFGGGVRPELGRTDYSAVAQGGMLAGQMAARGAESMAGGLASAGQSVAKAIDQYQRNKILTNEQIGKFEGAVQSGAIKLEALPEAMSKLANKLTKDGSLPLKDAAMLGAYADHFQQSQAKAMENEYRGLQISMAKQEINDQNALAQAIAMNTDTEGNLDAEGVLGSAIEFGLKDVGKYQNLKKQLSSGFTPEVRTIDTADGQKVTVVQTSTNQWQVLNQRTEREVAAVAEQNSRAEAFRAAQKAYSEGDTAEAIARLASIGQKNTLGGTVTEADLASILGVTPERAAISEEAEQAPTEKVVGGITYVKNSEGKWVKKK